MFTFLLFFIFHFILFIYFSSLLHVLQVYIIVSNSVSFFLISELNNDCQVFLWLFVGLFTSNCLFCAIVNFNFYFISLNSFLFHFYPIEAHSFSKEKEKDAYLDRMTGGEKMDKAEEVKNHNLDVLSKKINIILMKDKMFMKIYLNNFKTLNSKL